MTWLRHHVWFNRVLIGVTAVATVWCLGCSAFEPLLSCADVMGLADRMGMSNNPAGSAVFSASEGAASSVSAVPESADDGEAADCSCGCLSCYATGTLAIIEVQNSSTWDTLPFRPANILTGLALTPLVPPPQHTT